jgi:hypothetical protein
MGEPGQAGGDPKLPHNASPSQPKLGETDLLGRLPPRRTEDQSVCADLDTLPFSRTSLGQTQVQDAATDPRLDAGRINRI